MSLMTSIIRYELTRVSPKRWPNRRIADGQEATRGRALSVTRGRRSAATCDGHHRVRYRRALRVLGRAVDLAKVGAPVAVIGPGPGWRPRGRTSDVVPPAA